MIPNGIRCPFQLHLLLILRRILGPWRGIWAHVRHKSTVKTCDRPLSLLTSAVCRGIRSSRSPDELRVHPVLIQLNLVGTLINCVAHGRKPRGSVPEPILITARGIILLGAREWHAAIHEGRAALDCTEYPLDDDEALQLILTLHQSKGDWNDFARIRLAMQSRRHIFNRRPMRIESLAAS